MGWRYLLILVVVVTVVYFPGLSGGFVYDDYFNFLHNTAITETEFNLKGLLAAMQSGVAGPFGRPVPMLSFFLNYKLSGINPLGFKLFNIFVHVINAILIYFIFRHLLKTIFKQTTSLTEDIEYNGLAFWIALFWAVHPINLTAVLYIVQRMTSMAGMFTLLGILAYIYIREKAALTNKQLSLGFVVIVLFGILATLCKENGILLFLFLIIIEFFAYRFKFDNLQHKKIILSFFGVLIIVPIGIASYLIFNNGLSFDYSFREFSLQERLLTEGRVIWFYIGQIILPQADLFGLHHDDFTVSKNLFEPISTSLSLLGIIGVLIAAFISRKKNAWLGFGILFFLAGHVLESTVFPLNLVHEHRNYMPSLGLIVILVISLNKLLNKITFFNSKILFLVFAGLFSLVTFGRAHDWGDMNRLADKMILKHSDSLNSNYEAAYIYMKSFEQSSNVYYLNKAIDTLKKADKLSHNSMKSAITLMHVLSIAREPQNILFVDKIESNLRYGKVAADELIALRQFVSCLSQSVCKIDPIIIERLFSSLFDNPDVEGRLRDDSLYIYASYLDEVHNYGEQAIIILRDIVIRNPSIIEYKVKLISTLLSYGKNTEAEILMNELSNKYGVQWNIELQEE